MRLRGLVLLISAWILACSAVLASAQQSAPPPDKVAELLKLLGDPAVRNWIESQGNTAVPAKAAAQPLIATGMERWGTEVRANVRSVIAALPSVPGAIGGAIARVRAEADRNGLAPVTVVLAVVLLASLLGEWLVRRAVRHMRSENALVSRAVIELVPLLVFTLVAAGLYMAVDWPPMMGAVIFFYLLGAIVFRMIAAVAVTARTAGSLSPFLFRRVMLFAAILMVSLASLALAEPLGIDREVMSAAGVASSALLLAVCLEATWRQPHAGGPSIGRKVLQTAYFLLLWLVWMVSAEMIFWLLLYAAMLPRLLPDLDRFARAFAATRWPEDPEVSIPTVLVVRGLRAFVVALAVGWLAAVWQFNPRTSGALHALLDTVISGLFRSVIVILLADLGWSLARVAINRKLLAVRGGTSAGPTDAAQRARLRTLLPIFRNGLAALVLIIAALTVLAEMGIQIGPLIAGAGIFGVAIGFGSQTLVKDVISGVFYLMDDAFRIDEYIQSGNYKGTVESFSLRSVRLRHHRGPVFTVPFGELGAVQNMSRDWAIDKFMLRVNFDADIARVKKLVKQIGADMKADEELGPLIIETLKMKGVEQIGEFGIELSFAFTAVPGHQSVIRRRAYSAIRQAFVDNDIGFAQPTVQVGGEDKPGAAGAAHLMSVQRSQAAAAGNAPPPA